MGRFSVRRVAAVVALLVVLTGAFVAAWSETPTPVQKHLYKSRLVDAHLRAARARRHDLDVAIRRVQKLIGTVQAPIAAGSDGSAYPQFIGARAHVGGLHTQTRLRHLKHQLRREVAALQRRRNRLDVWFNTIGVFRRCPVPGWSSKADNFGVMVRIPKVPVHRHQGIDVMAPMGSPIVAPFDGVASSGSGVLGGNTVIVRGPLGWVYNAHLSAFSAHSNGAVLAGDVIGYVGATGDATAPHDHMEFHPRQIPANWPVSPFGYAVVGTAIDPNLMLQAACG